MLNNAGEPHAHWLRSVTNQAVAEWSLVRSVDEITLRGDALAMYAVSYALIRVGNVVAEHSRALEQVYQNYDWVYWVNLRNNLAHQPNEDDPVNLDEVWQAVTEWLPDLVQAVTGQLPT